MTVRKTNPKPSSNTPKKTAKKAPPARQNTGSQELKSWISKLESELLKESEKKRPKNLLLTQIHLKRQRELSLEFPRDWWPADAIRARNKKTHEEYERIKALKLAAATAHREMLRSMAGDFCKELTVQEKLLENLLFIWADVAFWKTLRECEPLAPGTQCDDARKLLIREYGMDFPFSPTVWLQAVREPKQANLLVLLMEGQASKFFHVPEPTEQEKRWLAMLSEELLGEQLHRYVHNPSKDSRPNLRMALMDGNYSPTFLNAISSSVRRLADDITHIALYPDNFEGLRAPTHKKPHRTRKLPEAKAIVEMVEVVRKKLKISTNGLAQTYFDCANSAERRLAREAILLGRYRDNLPV